MLLAILLAASWAPSTGEVACEGAALTSVWLDVGMTRAFLHDEPLAFEANPILGRHPSQGRVFWLGGVAASALLLTGWLALPPPYRYLACAPVVAYELMNLPALAAANGSFTLRF